MNKVKVTILGKDYVLKTPEKEEAPLKEKAPAKEEFQKRRGFKIRSLGERKKLKWNNLYV